MQRRYRNIAFLGVLSLTDMYEHCSGFHVLPSGLIIIIIIIIILIIINIIIIIITINLIIVIIIIIINLLYIYILYMDSHCFQLPIYYKYNNIIFNIIIR